MSCSGLSHHLNLWEDAVLLHCRVLPGQLLDSNNPATTWGAPGNLVLVVLPLSTALVLLCQVPPCRAAGDAASDHLLLAALDIPFMILDGMCSLAAPHARPLTLWTLDWHPELTVAVSLCSGLSMAGLCMGRVCPLQLPTHLLLSCLLLELSPVPCCHCCCAYCHLICVTIGHALHHVTQGVMGGAQPLPDTSVLSL